MLRLRILLSLTFTLAATTGGTAARAAEVADGGRGGSATIERRSLQKNDAARLVRGELADINTLDAKYAKPGTLNRCVNKWNEFRRKPVVVKPIGVTLGVLRANADAAGLSRRKLHNVVAVYLKNQDQLPNQRYITIVDFDRRSNTPRMFTINLASGRIDKMYVSASYGSSPRADGYSTHFSNVGETNANSLGCAVASGEYNGKRGRRSLVLHGIEKTNDNTCQRSIIMHKANYVGGDGPSRSEGCLAFRPQDEDKVFDRVGGGGLICSYREGKVSAAVALHPRPGRRYHAARHHHRRYHRRHHAY